MSGIVIDFDEYQKRANETAIYPEAGTGSVAAVSYVTHGLTGEAGEIANKVKKILRDAKGRLTLENRMALQKEVGDVLWYVNALCRELGMTMKEVAILNILNLAERKKKGTLQGEGDDR